MGGKDHRHYRTLHWTPDMDGAWSDDAARRYIAGGYEGVNYRIPRGTTHASLDFALSLPGLRYLSVHGKVADDSAVNQIGSLESLTLLTRSKVPLAVDQLHHLEFLGVTARKDLGSMQDLIGLQRLVIAGWQGADLTFLGTKPALESLRLDGRPGRLALDGIEQCPTLRELEVLDYRLPTLTPLRTLTALERILLSGPRRLPPDNDLNLDDLTAMRHLRSLRLINAGTIRSLHPLRRLPSLRDLSLNNVAIDDGDLGVLFALPSHVEVSPPVELIDGQNHHSHTVKELAKLRKPRR
ncbi:hypothetical protein ACQPZX_49080 [Actinoplanes sp. CA-142083]|uniref:hypothetical protein n=1 Tax=Actinoplanes sp. CA-142083 TaxID=3239903 RepID=UPI003D9471BF